QNAVFDPRRAANGIVVETFAEGVAKVEAQLAQQRVKTQQTQDLPGAPRAHIGNLTLTEVGFQDAVKRSFIGCPWRCAPVQIVIHIEGRSAKRRANAEEVSCG